MQQAAAVSLFADVDDPHALAVRRHFSDINKLHTKLGAVRIQQAPDSLIFYMILILEREKILLQILIHSGGRYHLFCSFPVSGLKRACCPCFFS